VMFLKTRRRSPSRSECLAISGSSQVRCYDEQQVLARSVYCRDQRPTRRAPRRTSCVSRVRILQISDLHERAPFPWMPETRASQIQLDAEERGYGLGPRFSEALREAAKGGVDLVCFTGDLADWGHPMEYVSASKRLGAILQAVNLPVGRFFEMPGNHDVQRRVRADPRKNLWDWYARSNDGRALGRWFRGVGDARPAPKARGSSNHSSEEARCQTVPK
jgi:hypothetical protein